MKERRREDRLREENKVILSIMANGNIHGPKEIYFSLTRDISPGGIRIMTDAPLPLDARVKVEISLAKSRIRLQGITRVCWVKELFGKDVFEMGLEFLDLDPETELSLVEHIYKKSMSRH